MPMVNCRLPAIYWFIWLEVKTAEDNASADVVESSCSFLTSCRDYCWGGIAVYAMMIFLFGHFFNDQRMAIRKWTQQCDWEIGRPNIKIYVREVVHKGAFCFHNGISRPAECQ